MRGDLALKRRILDVAAELNAMMDSLEDDTPAEDVYSEILERWRDLQAIADEMTVTS